MAVKFTRLAHKIVMKPHLVAESCTIYSSCSRHQSGNFWIQSRICS